MLHSTTQTCYIKHLLFHIGTDCPTIIAFQFLQNMEQKGETFVRTEKHLIKAFHVLLDLEEFHNIAVTHIHVKLQKRKR